MRKIYFGKVKISRKLSARAKKKTDAAISTESISSCFLLLFVRDVKN